MSPKETSVPVAAKMLIVADDRPTVTFVEGVVSNLGCTYEMALNLRQAEDLALASPVDLLITGVTTSVSEDLGVLQRLKARSSAVTAERLVHSMDIAESDLSDGDRYAVGTAFRELRLNAIEHGGRFRPDQRVHITSVRTPRAVVYMIRDPGEGFTSTALPHAALSNPDEGPTRHAEYRERVGMRPGGFGLLVARGLVDDVVHNERGTGVLLIKYLQPSSGPDAATDTPLDFIRARTSSAQIPHEGEDSQAVGGTSSGASE